MIDINKVKDGVDNYISKYDINDKQIRLKKEHLKRVSRYSHILAQKLKLNEEEILLAETIGLLHDIGRFEQIKKYHTFIDKDSIDHGELGCKILFDDNLIETLIEDKTYYKIIRDSIINHNRPKSKILNSRSNLHTRILKDSDKTDILFLSLNKNKQEIVFGKNFKDNEISDEIYNDFITKHSIDYNNIKNSTDVIICHFAYIFDYNFDEALKYIYQHQYIDRLYSSIRLNNTDSIYKLNNCYLETKKYMKKRLFRH